MRPEFDQYAPEYSTLLNDPLRDRFTSDPVFFHRRKWMLIRDFFAQRRINSSKLRWLDVGCGQGRALLTKSIKRVLKPGGLFCLIEHNPWNPVTQAIVKRCPVDSDAELLTAPAAARLVGTVDLEILETAYFLYFPESIFRHIGRIEQSLRNLPLGGQYAVFCLNSAEVFEEATYATELEAPKTIL